MKRVFVFTVALFALLTFAGCARSEFSKPAALEAYKEALAAKGLTVCAERDLDWKTVPGFVSGKQYDVEIDCVAFDANKPGARVTVVQFADNDAREAALRNFETVYRRHIGSGVSYTNGPLVILIDGNQKDVVIALVRQALAETGAQK